jgi:DNA invertase Pin-like site-specific DNA recombinase
LLWRKAAGATRVLSEKLSGAGFDRPQLREAIAALSKDGVLLVTRLDRLARSTRDLLNLLHEVGELGAAFKSLADSWADTTTPHGKLMVTVLGGLAECERSLIQGARRSWHSARERSGCQVRSPSKLTKHQQRQAIKLLDAGEPQSAVARLLNVDQSTISRLATRLAA